MSTLTITDVITGTELTPELWRPLRMSRPGRARLHPRISGGTDVTYAQPGALRSGTLELYVRSQTAADELDYLHAEGTLFTATFAAEPLVVWSMSYVVPEGQQVELEQQDGATTVWRVAIPYQEVAG